MSTQKNHAQYLKVATIYLNMHIKSCGYWYTKHVHVYCRRRLKMNSFMAYLSTPWASKRTNSCRQKCGVKQVKEHIKHMCSIKTEINVRNRSSVISNIREIADHYDEMSGIVKRKACR